MRRFKPSLVLAAVALALAACQESTTVDPMAPLWVPEVMSGACKSAIPYRSRDSHVPVSPTYHVVRSLVCPVAGDATRDTVQLLQLRTAKGEFFWVEAEMVGF